MYSDGKSMRNLFLFILLLFSTFLLPAQDSPKREMRAAWIVTVFNTDWPSSPNLGSAQSKQELVELIESLHQLHLNAIILQVRPAGDALYDSSFEPWSYWLTGEQGRAPAPYFDPLQTAIDLCHQKGMEVHAWFNPFRADLLGKDTIYRHPNHITQMQPEWLLQYGKRLYFDPGLPEVRKYAVDVILDVVNRYDIDAVHLDDYFYPYRIPKVDFPDTTSYDRFGVGMEREAWRRHNVDLFMEKLHDDIRLARPDLKIGVSPFGVWRNNDRDPQGSATQAGQTSYDDLFADVRKWIVKGWVDYIAPQAYFSIGYEPADYEELVNWWSRNAFGRHVYIGQSLYKVDNNHDLNWEDPTQVPRQIRINRSYPEVKGTMHYSSRYFELNPLGIKDSFSQDLYPYKALPPVMDWLDSDAPVAPIRPKVRSTKEGLRLTWNMVPEEAAYLAIYRFPKKTVGPRSNPVTLKEVIGVEEKEWIDKDTYFLKRYNYVITALDRHYNESKGSPSSKRRRWSRGKKEGNKD